MKVTKQISKFIAVSGLSTAILLSNNSFAAEELTKSTFYIGADAFIARTIKRKVKDDSGAILKFGNAKAYSGKLGYRLQDDLSVELSYTTERKYPMEVILPQGNLSGKGKSTFDMLTLSTVHDLNHVSGFVPYITVGVGLGKVSTDRIEIEAAPNHPAFRIKKKSSYTPVIQVGLGVKKEVFSGFNLTLNGKMIIATSPKLYYEKFNQTTTAWENGKMKKTLGVFQLTAGFTLDLPI